jgi:hypothetical protein
MNLYRITAPGKQPHWFGSQADCAAYRKELTSEHKIPRSAIGTETIDVPTKKEDLIAWLTVREV